MPKVCPIRLVALLGAGAFAHTWRAQVLSQDLSDEWGTDEVAVKVPRDRERERVLIQELIHNATLNHVLQDVGSENIARYLGFEELDGKYVMITEFAPGGNLSKWINRSKPCSIDRTLRVFSGILRGLAAIHRSGIAHCDIKPANILLAGETAKIGDLGISRFLSGSHRSGVAAGTIAYLPPENILRGILGVESDLWAAGVVLYELLAGVHPFADDTSSTEDIRERICRGKFIPIEQARKDVPDKLAAALRALLRTDPKERPAANNLVSVLTATPPPDDREQVYSRERGQMLDDPNRAEIEDRLRHLSSKDPCNPVAYELLAEMFILRGQTERAIHELSFGIDHCPNAASLYWRKGLAEHTAHAYTAAVASFEHARRLGLAGRENRFATALIVSMRAEQE